VDAFERYDITSLTALLREDAVLSMPPYEFWLQGPVEMGKWFLGGGIGCRDSRLIATSANGCPAFGSYRPDPAGGHSPWSLQVIEVAGDRIIGQHNFLDTSLFARSGCPPTSTTRPSRSSSSASAVLISASRIDQPPGARQLHSGQLIHDARVRAADADQRPARDLGPVAGDDDGRIRGGHMNRTTLWAGSNRRSGPR